MDPEIVVHNLLDSCDKPLIGLEHIEYLSSQKLHGRKGVGYKCNLCISTGMSEFDIIPHVTGLTHRLAYLKKNYVDLYKNCMDGIHNDTKNLPFRVEDMASLVEKNVGRKRIYFSLGARRELKELYQDPDGASGSNSSFVQQSWESQLAQHSNHSNLGISAQEEQRVAQAEWLRQVLVLGQQPENSPAPTWSRDWSGEDDGSRDCPEPRSSYEVVAKAAREWAAFHGNSSHCHMNVDVGGGMGPSTNTSHKNDHKASDTRAGGNQRKHELNADNRKPGEASTRDDNGTSATRSRDTKKMKRNAADLYVICFDNDGSYEPQDAPGIAKRYSSCGHLSSVTISKKTVSLKFTDRESVKSALRQGRNSGYDIYIHPDCIHREHKKEDNRSSNSTKREYESKTYSNSMGNTEYDKSGGERAKRGKTSALNQNFEHYPASASATYHMPVSQQPYYTAPITAGPIAPVKTMSERYSDIREKQAQFLQEFRGYLLCLKAAKLGQNLDLITGIVQSADCKLFPDCDVDKIDKLRIFIEECMEKERSAAESH